MSPLVPFIVRAGQPGGGGGGTDIFTMTYSDTPTPGTSPLAGFNGGLSSLNGNESRITYSRQAGAGPGGQDVYRVETQVAGAWEGDPGFALNNFTSATGFSIVPGATLFGRIAYRHPQGTGGGQGYSCKFIQLSHTSGNDTGKRQALLMYPYDSISQHRIIFGHGSGYYYNGSGAEAWDTVSRTNSATWRYMQWAWTFNNPANVPNGRIRFWDNNPNENSPNIDFVVTQEDGLNPGPSADHFLTLFGYHQPGVDATQFARVEFFGFALSTGFYPNWQP